MTRLCSFSLEINFALCLSRYKAEIPLWYYIIQSIILLEKHVLKCSRIRGSISFLAIAQLYTQEVQNRALLEELSISSCWVRGEGISFLGVCMPLLREPMDFASKREPRMSRSLVPLFMKAGRIYKLRKEGSQALLVTRQCAKVNNYLGITVSECHDYYGRDHSSRQICLWSSELTS